MTLIACATVDLDPLRCYLDARGLDRSAESSPHTVYQDGLPLFLRLFKKHSVRATFFAVGSELSVPENVSILKKVLEDGHEIANHGLTHHANLSDLIDSDLRKEVFEGKKTIESACGVHVSGFRAPRWSVCDRLFGMLCEAGYRYDSSLVPVPISRLLPVLKHIWPERLPDGIFGQQKNWRVPPPRPYRVDTSKPWRAGDSSLVEIPAGFSAMPLAPLNLTVSARLGDLLSPFLEHLASVSRNPLVFIFHGLDLVDFDKHVRDSRLAAKPGLTDPIEKKISRVERVLANIGRKREWIRLTDLAGRVSKGTSQD